MRWLCYLSLRELICNRFVQVFVCDDVKLAQLVRCRTVNPKDVGSIPAKTQKKTRIQIYMEGLSLLGFTGTFQTKPGLRRPTVQGGVFCHIFPNNILARVLYIRRV